MFVVAFHLVTLFQLYHDIDMIDNEMRRKKPKPTLLLTQRIFDLPHHIVII